MLTELSDMRLSIFKHVPVSNPPPEKYIVRIKEVMKLGAGDVFKRERPQNESIWFNLYSKKGLAPWTDLTNRTIFVIANKVFVRRFPTEFVAPSKVADPVNSRRRTAVFYDSREYPKSVAWHDGFSHQIKINLLECHEGPLHGYQRFVINAIGFDHLAELLAVNPQRAATDQDQNNFADDLSYFQRIPRRTLGMAMSIVGIIIGIPSHFCLRWSRLNHWPLKRRFLWGLTGWTIAIVLIWHGYDLLNVCK
jgi:hypothetical protein